MLFASETDIADPLARRLYNRVVEYFNPLRPEHAEEVITAAASLLSGFLTDIEPARKAKLIEGIYTALKTEHGIP